MKRPQLTFSSVTERDVDLLLVEELKCSDRFRNWFLRLVAADLGIGVSGAITDVLVLHSVSASTGESDVRLDFSVGDIGRKRRWALLIENKIDAPFQMEQPQRYRLRAEEAKASEDVDEVATVLVAPDDYLNEAQGREAFDALVSYEDLRKYCEKPGTVTLLADCVKGIRGQV